MPTYRGGRHEHGQNFLTDPSTIATITRLVTTTDLSWLICLVRGFGVAEGVEDHLLVCGDGRGEGLGGAVDRDGGRAQWA